MRTKLNALLEPAMPEQHIALKSESIDLKFTLTPLTQIALGSGTAFLAGWLAVSSTAFFLNMQADGNTERQTSVMATAYEARIADLEEQLEYETEVASQSQDRLQFVKKTG